LEHVRRLNVFVYDRKVGTLRVARNSKEGKEIHVLEYIKGTPEQYSTSLTLPVSIEGEEHLRYVFEDGLPPALTQNLPQGSVRSEMNSAFSKIPGFTGLTDMDFLMLTGLNQIGRVSFSQEEFLTEVRPFNVEKSDIINTRNGAKLFHSLSTRVNRKQGEYDGVAGNVPKLLTDTISRGPDVQVKSSRTLVSSKDILKATKISLPDLCINEHTCINIARASGLRSADTLISRDGSLLLVKRFDRFNGKKIGFDDFSSLIGHNDVNRATYSDIFRIIKTMSIPKGMEMDRNKIMLDLFKRIAISNIVHDNDLHLKNAALIYSRNKIKMAPAYDIACTDVISLPGGIPMPASTSRMAMRWSERDSADWKRKDALIEFGVEQGIPEHLCNKILDDMVTGIRKWLNIPKHGAHPTIQDISTTVKGSLHDFMKPSPVLESLDLG